MRNNLRRQENRRNENGLTSREQEKQDKINLIKQLKDNGLNNNQIAKELKINRSTVTKYLKL
ncbi:helix-turn-helix domain-containing protein [Clostridioides sp. ES-S-0049-03]|uniref:helix-turn-helix domain-containing protein n=1 Tax=Clostridioides sp. ES-S-0049-03 TaxID=2770779 RepID=UPI001DE2DD98|nr:helix-turn-helix domain-containing protein [Clostridioides sp. ES-S-0049-03]MCC0678585.1 helix-turn-helix domain-containing protein [Clostridioides sp. ES-W-0018-02]MCC0713446.1 helix-turn-helix domain-containing protein [Clostridioides sp. ES-W-0017-02]